MPAPRLLLWFLAFLLPLSAAGAEPPALILDAPPSLAPVLERLRGFDRARLAAALRLTGEPENRQAITLYLAEESSPAARRAPPWAAGYADGRSGAVVILPARIPHYPDNSLEAVVQHEVTHVLIDRAAHFRELPRWFHEGVAMAAARAWTFEDRRELAWGVFAGGPTTLAGVDRAFYQGAGDARAAYALANALVQRLQREAGAGVTAAIIHGVAEGQSFEAAFAAAAGQPLATFEGSFFRRQLLWLRWVPFLASGTTLWTGITLLALWAFRRRKERDRALHARWEREDQARRVLPSPAAAPASLNDLDEDEELVNGG